MCGLGLLLLAACVCLSVRAQAAPRATVEAPATTLALGAQAPAFTLPDTEGRARTLTEWAGRPVVLNFWAFWCDTWKAELPSLRALSEAQAVLGFSLVTVSVDGTRVPEFVRQRGTPVPFPALLDIGGEVSRVYGITHVPTVVVLDAQGRVCYAHTGYPGNDALLSVLRRLCTAPAHRDASGDEQPPAQEKPGPHRRRNNKAMP